MVTLRTLALLMKARCTSYESPFLFTLLPTTEALLMYGARTNGVTRLRSVCEVGSGCRYSSVSARAIDTEPILVK